MRLNAQQQETIRTYPQRTRLNLFIFNPRPVLKACLSSEMDKGSQNIPYIAVTGSYSALEPDMALLVGSADGLEDYGRVRIRTGSSSSFVVAENDDIRWVSGSYLTALRYWDILPVFPRIIKNPNNETDVIFYKDYDIPHTNQNNTLGTFINAGSHRGVLLENGTGTVYYSSTGTLNVANSSLTYDWAFEGGNPTGSTSANPGYVNYTTPGDYVTRLKITAGNGAVDTTYRYVSVKNKIGEGSVTPIARWKASSISGSRSEGGYSVGITVYDNIQIRDGSVVVITSEDWYGDSKVSLGGNNPNGENIFFVGYVEAGSIKYSWDRNFFEFTASSVTALMKKTTGFSISVESKQASSTWFQLQDMDVRRAIYHYLRWHTTVLRTTDVRFNGQDRKIQYFDADRTSLYDAINNLMSDTLMGSVASDRQGALYAEVQPVGYDNPTGSFAPVMDISKRDWMGTPSIENRPYSQSSYIELGGIAYSGAFTGTFTAHLSGAPGDTPAEHGSVDTDPGGLAITGQEQLNQLTGNVFYNNKFKYPNISMENPYGLRNLDIAPYESVKIDMLPDENVLGADIHNQYVPNAMSFQYDSEKEVLRSSVELSSVVTGIPGSTILIPEKSEDIGMDIDIPDFSFPPFAVDVPIFSITSPSSIDNVLFWVRSVGFFYTTNYSDEHPNWSSMMANIFPSYGDPINFEITASGKVFAHFYQFIFKADYLGAEWQMIFDAVPNLFNTGVENPELFPFPRFQAVLAMGVDRNADEDVFLIGTLVHGVGSDCSAYGYKWDGSEFVRVNDVAITYVSGVVRLGYIIRTNNRWLMSYCTYPNIPHTAFLDDENYTLSHVTTYPPPPEGSIVLENSNFSNSTAIAKLFDLYPQYTVDGGETWTLLSGSVYVPWYNPWDRDIHHNIIADGLGTIVYGWYPFFGYRYSVDGGATFNDSSVFSGVATAINHLGGTTYIMGESGGWSNVGHIWHVDGLGAFSTGTSIISKDGNMPYLITGAYTISLFRFCANGGDL